MIRRISCWISKTANTQSDLLLSKSKRVTPARLGIALYVRCLPSANQCPDRHSTQRLLTSEPGSFSEDPGKSLHLSTRKCRIAV